MDDRGQEHLSERLARLEAWAEEWARSVERRLEDGVKRAEFWPVKAIVYGAIGSALLALLGKLVAMVLAH